MGAGGKALPSQVALAQLLFQGDSACLNPKVNSYRRPRTRRSFLILRCHDRSGLLRAQGVSKWPVCETTAM